VKDVIACATFSSVLAEAVSRSRRFAKASMLRLSEELRLSGPGGGTVGVADMIVPIPSLP
jgi:hypothetical protein